MCAPTHYGLDYEINPWMSLQNKPDKSEAENQWNLLYHTLKDTIGVDVELISQAEECPDQVFTANAGLLRGNVAALSSFRHPQRQLEEKYFNGWFEENGYQVVRSPAGCSFEGEGDVLYAGETLLAGYLKRSDICAHSWLSEALGCYVLSLQLTDDRWYHLDTCLCPLDAENILYFPGAFDEYACRVLNNSFNMIAIEEQEALRFACNSVVIGKHIVMPAGCPLIQKVLKDKGYIVHSVEMSEFLKAGGACKCLTLYLTP